MFKSDIQAFTSNQTATILPTRLLEKPPYHPGKNYSDPTGRTGWRSFACVIIQPQTSDLNMLSGRNPLYDSADFPRLFSRSTSEQT